LALHGVQVDAYRRDAQGMEEALRLLRLAVRGAGGVVLLLGGLGARHRAGHRPERIREIGVRRSFGATSGRIFAAVMLESVCATALAGLLPAVIAFRAKVIEAIRF
jgi:putative ABC transport system permease protein